MNDKITPKELPIKVDRCPTKHKKAYKTSFGGLFCPDCSHNIETKKFVRQARLPRDAYTKDLKEVLGGFKK